MVIRSGREVKWRKGDYLKLYCKKYVCFALKSSPIINEFFSVCMNVSSNGGVMTRGGSRLSILKWRYDRILFECLTLVYNRPFDLSVVRSIVRLSVHNVSRQESFFFEFSFNIIWLCGSDCMYISDLRFFQSTK